MKQKKVTINSNERDSVILLTVMYPYSSGETFIENEIKYLAKYFNKVVIIPVNVGEEEGDHDINETDRLKDLPSNVFVEVVKPKKKSSVSYFFSPFKSEFTHLPTFRKLLNFRVFRQYLGSLKKSLNYLDPFEKLIKKHNLTNSVVYSYWGEFWLVPLIHVRKKYNLKVIARFHRYDIYNEGYDFNYFPFKPYILTKLDGVYPISMEGLDYLKDNYRITENNDCYYLGIEPHDFTNKIDTEKGYCQIVSCAGMRDVKQIDILIDALREITFEVKWHHLGDGPLWEELNQQAATLPQNIKYKLHGQKTNTEVYDFYKNNPVDIFINSSKSEGIPVSIMEAMSFGIPIIAPNVGGMPEIITNEVNGMLLSKNITVSELQNSIEMYYGFDSSKQKEWRKMARKMWAEKFDASKNYYRFYDQITK